MDGSRDHRPAHDATASTQRARREPVVDPDATYAAILARVERLGLRLYPHQDEAILEWLGGSHVVLATPTGSGKSLVAFAVHQAALAAGVRSAYTAPIKALVSEKFFDLLAAFGAEQVGMLTGDVSVNPTAPIIACTAEVLANMALREGDHLPIAAVVMDEFHYYGDAERGWAWQVPLLELPDTRFLLMSATLGDMSAIADDLTARTGREVAVIADAPRPVPLTFSWSMEPLDETLTELVTTHQAPVYVVHQTQAGAAEHAQALGTAGGLPNGLLSAEQKARIAASLAPVRFAAGFGRTLGPLLRKGIGVHHAGMLPRYRRLVEQLAQAGLLQVICGTDTLGVGINVPIRTVLFTALTKFDGSRTRVLRAREFHQIAGRAGRAGFDTTGSVVVQAPAHVIDNARAIARIVDKHGPDPRRLRSFQRKKPPEGFVVWTEQTFDKLVTAPPETLRPHLRVDNAMLLNVVARHGDPVASLSRLTRGNHQSPQQQARLARRAIRLGRSLLDSGILLRRAAPDPQGRTLALTVDLPADFALNQPLAHFALAALELLDAASPQHALEVLSVVEAVLDPPRPILAQQQWLARGETLQALKADGVEYEERMALVESITWPRPLAELLEAGYELYRARHPWLPADALDPKSVVRAMWEGGQSFTDFVSTLGLARSEGLVLRYLSDVYRTLTQTVPDSHRNEELDSIIEWLGETVRQTDSSLLDEWDALLHPDRAAAGRPADAGSAQQAPPPPRPLTANGRAFRAMVRRAMWRRVELAARDDIEALAALERSAAAVTDPAGEVLVDRHEWDRALGDYWHEHDTIATDADARGPGMFQVSEVAADHDNPGRTWRVRQVLADPQEDHDWAIEAIVDLERSDAVGEPVLTVTGVRRL